MNFPTAEQQGIRCHAEPDKPAPAISKPGASSLDFWIPAPGSNPGQASPEGRLAASSWNSNLDFEKTNAYQEQHRNSNCLILC